MITAAYMTFHKYEMKIDYLRAVCDEGPLNPLDYGCIDAPRYICAGSTFSNEYLPGKFTGLHSLAGRSA